MQVRTVTGQFDCAMPLQNLPMVLYRVALPVTDPVGVDQSAYLAPR